MEALTKSYNGFNGFKHHLELTINCMLDETTTRLAAAVLVHCTLYSFFSAVSTEWPKKPECYIARSVSERHPVLWQWTSVCCVRRAGRTKAERPYRKTSERKIAVSNSKSGRAWQGWHAPERELHPQMVRQQLWSCCSSFWFHMKMVTAVRYVYDTTHDTSDTKLEGDDVLIFYIFFVAISWLLLYPWHKSVAWRHKTDNMKLSCCRENARHCISITNVFTHKTAKVGQWSRYRCTPRMQTIIYTLFSELF